MLLLSNFMLLKLFTNDLSVSDFGYYSLSMSIVLFIRQIIYDPFSMVIAKQSAAIAGDHINVARKFAIINFASNQAAMLILMVSLACILIFIKWGGEDVLTYAFLFSSIYLIANGGQGVYFNVLNAVGERYSAALLSTLDSILKISSAYLFFKYFGANLNNALISIAFGSAIVLLIIRASNAKKLTEIKFKRNELGNASKKYLLASIPLYFPVFLAAIKSVGDRWLLTGFIGVDDLAAYTVLTQVGYSPVIIAFGIIQTYIAPKLYKLCADKTQNLAGDLSKLMVRILCVLAVGAVLFCGLALLLEDWIFELLVGKNYHSFAKYLPIFVTAGFLAAAAGILQVVVFGIFESTVFGNLMAFSVGLSIVFTAVLIQEFGFSGAILGLIAGGFIPFCVFAFAIYRRAFKKY